MNKVAFITGATRGIGSQIAYTLAKQGYNIVVNYRKENEDFENLKKYSDFIAHVHVAEFKTRKLPSAGDGCDYKNVVKLLQNSGYNGRVSVEAHDEFTLQKYRGAMEAIRI